MALIPQRKNTTEYQIEHIQYNKKPRDYLSMSGIGKECLRRQWYGWRWTVFKPVIARVQRIFSRGDAEEKSIITDLKSVGIEVFRRDGDKKIEIFGDKEEQEELIGSHGHAKGHPDGRALGIIEAPKTEHLLEYKTMQLKYYLILKEKGIKAGFKEYYSQITRYMGKMKLTRCMFIATNKNDQARYYKRIKFDKKHYEILLEREEAIILSELPPKKAYKADHYICQWCPFYQVCHLGATPEKNCRTCKHCDLMPAGKWECGKTGKELSYKKQLKGCKKYKRLF